MIVTFDPSLTHWGVCVYDNDMIKTYTIVTKKEKAKSVFLDDLRRVAQIWNEIEQYRHLEVYAESPTGSQSARASFGRGIVIALLSTFTNITFFTPTEIKKHFTANSKASKDEMKNKVKEVYGLDVNEHEADALAILHLVQTKKAKSTKKRQT